MYARRLYNIERTIDVNVNAEVKNPFKDLTTEELKKLANSDEDTK